MDTNAVAPVPKPRTKLPSAPQGEPANSQPTATIHEKESGDVHGKFPENTTPKMVKDTLNNVLAQQNLYPFDELTRVACGDAGVSSTPPPLPAKPKPKHDSTPKYSNVVAQLALNIQNIQNKSASPESPISPPSKIAPPPPRPPPPGWKPEICQTPIPQEPPQLPPSKPLRMKMVGPPPPVPERGSSTGINANKPLPTLPPRAANAMSYEPRSVDDVKSTSTSPPKSLGSPTTSATATPMTPSTSTTTYEELASLDSPTHVRLSDATTNVEKINPFKVRNGVLIVENPIYMSLAELRAKPPQKQQQPAAVVVDAATTTTTTATSPAAADVPRLTVSSRRQLSGDSSSGSSTWTPTSFQTMSSPTPPRMSGESPTGEYSVELNGFELSQRLQAVSNSPDSDELAKEVVVIARPTGLDAKDARDSTGLQPQAPPNPYTPSPRRSDFSNSTATNWAALATSTPAHVQNEYVNLGSMDDPFDKTPTEAAHFATSARCTMDELLGLIGDPAGYDAQGETYTAVNKNRRCSGDGHSSDEPTTTSTLHSERGRGASASDESSSGDDTTTTTSSSMMNQQHQYRDVVDGTVVSFVGPVVLVHGKKERRVLARLNDMKLFIYDDDEAEECSSGPYKMQDCLLVRLAKNGPAGADGQLVHLVVGDKKEKLVFRPEEESAKSWVVFLVEAWLSQYPVFAVCNDNGDAVICGRIWIRQGSAGVWKKASAVIAGSNFCFVTKDDESETNEVDIRKLLGVKEKVDKSEWCVQCKNKHNGRGPIVLLLDGSSLYIECEDETTTQAWHQAIDDVLNRPQTRLENCRLTHDNVPFFVDKCIRYLSAYGMKVEGIHRRPGGNTERAEISKRLHEDPVGYHIAHVNNDTVMSTASVLREFFRGLEVPLFPNSIYDELSHLSYQPASGELWEKYSKLLRGGLPPVYWHTLRKLIVHLKTLTEHEEHNRASAPNLGSVFAPSLFQAELESQMNDFNISAQTSVIVHLILGCDSIFKITPTEEISRVMYKEAELRSNSNKRTNNILIPVHMWQHENRSFNAKSDLAAEEVCRQAIASRGFDRPADGNFALFEVVCNGALSRRMGLGERLSTIALSRWIQWKCCDGYLLFDLDLEPFDQTFTNSFTEKVKMAEPGSKTFKSFEFKLADGGQISAYRNEKFWKTWSVDDVVWFVGAQNTRKAPNAYNATMLPATKENLMGTRLPGFCLSFKTQAERTKWLNALEYVQTGGKPTPLVHI